MGDWETGRLGDWGTGGLGDELSEKKFTLHNQPVGVPLVGTLH
jgi:hypothetical protein